MTNWRGRPVLQKMPVNNFVLLLLMAVIIPSGYGARILVICPMPSTSHHAVISTLAKELAARKHEITMISSFPEKNPLPNYKDIVLSKEVGQQALDTYGNMFTDQPTTAFGTVYELWTLANFLAEDALQHPEIQQLIHSTEKLFDLVVVEAFFNEAYFGFAHKFKAPLVTICPFGGAISMHSTVGNPNPVSYIPDVFLNYNDRMTFLERLHNTVWTAVQLLGHELYHLPKQEAIMRKYFNDSGPLPSIHELQSHTALLMVNMHISLSYPRPLVPNLVEIGGLHIKSPKKLPQDLQKYLDDAPNGVIYFSMGSYLRSSELPHETRDVIVKTLSKLKQKVMWKWEEDELPGQPANMLVRKWFPQADILAHPNVKLFITHGGLLGTMEAISYGVPLLGIPIFGDQRLNMVRAQLSGYGLGINFDNLTSESLEWGLNTVLNQPSYLENAKRISQLFKDRPQTAKETAVYWVEYVLRHKGAPHLRSAALDLHWYQYFLLDVIAVILAALVFVAMLAYFSLRTVYRFIVRKPNKKQKVSKSKKRK